MEQETFLSGYCRTLDQSRMVAVVTQDGSLLEVDCSYDSCPFAPGCSIAQQIQALIK